MIPKHFNNIVSAWSDESWKNVCQKKPLYNRKCWVNSYKLFKCWFHMNANWINWRCRMAATLAEQWWVQLSGKTAIFANFDNTKHTVLFSTSQYNVAIYTGDKSVESRLFHYCNTTVNSESFVIFPLTFSKNRQLFRDAGGSRMAIKWFKQGKKGKRHPTTTQTWTHTFSHCACLSHFSITYERLFNECSA